MANSIENKTTVMPLEKRVSMYAQTLDGIEGNAWVEDQGDRVVIDWVLGVAEHCPDCLILAANSPYTKLSLPTTPRAGSTKCLSNCRCSLRRKRSLASKDVMSDVQQYQAKRDMSLLEMVADPEPPKGLVRPTEEDALVIGDLRLKINFWRRKIAEAKNKKAKSQAIKMRKKYNQELIDYTKNNKVHEVPVFSVDEILDASDIGEHAVNEALVVSSGDIQLLSQSEFGKFLREIQDGDL